MIQRECLSTVHIYYAVLKFDKVQSVKKDY